MQNNVVQLLKPLIYLAGPITGLSYGTSTDWRQYVNSNIDPKLQTLSPMRHKEYLSQEKSIAAAYENHVMSCAKGITSRDRFDCMRANAVLVNLLGAKERSIGTIMEVAWADAQRTPIILVVEKDNTHRHPMLLEAAGFVVDNLDAGISVVERILIPEGCLDSRSITARMTANPQKAA